MKKFLIFLNQNLNVSEELINNISLDLKNRKIKEIELKKFYNLTMQVWVLLL